MRITNGDTVNVNVTEKIDDGYVVSRNPSAIRRIFEKAKTQPVVILRYDDSQGTVTSAGAVYLNGYFFQRYRNTPITTVGSMMSSGSIGSPGDWLMRTSRSSGVVATAIPTSYALPGFALQGLQATGNMHVTYCDKYSRFTQPHLCLHNGLYFQSGTHVDIEFFLYTGNPSGTLNWYCTAHNNLNPDHFSAVQSSGTIDASQLNSATIECRKFLVENVSLGGKVYPQVKMVGSSAVDLVNAMGLRFKSRVNRSGIIVQQIAVGGYRMHHLYSTHGDSKSAFAALNPDMLLVCLGANNAYGGDSVATFETECKGVISWVRSFMGDEFPIVFASECYRADLGTTPGWATLTAEKMLYHAMQRNLALTYDRNVHFIDKYKLAYDMGLNDLNEEPGTKTDRGEWADATAYVVGDYVHVKATNPAMVRSEYMRFECITAHTSSPSITVLDTLYWQPFRHHLVDNVHFTPEGARKSSECEGMLLLNGFGNVSL